MDTVVSDEGKGSLDDSSFEPFVDGERYIYLPPTEMDNNNEDEKPNAHYGSVEKDISQEEIEEEDESDIPKVKRYMILSILILVTFLGKAERTMIAPFYPIYAQEKNITELGIGVVIGSFDLSILFSSLIWGFVIAKIGARMTYAIGIVGTSIFSAMFAPLALVEDGTTFLALSITLRVLMGAFCGAYLVGETTILVTVFPKKIGIVIGIMETFGGIAVMLGPLIGGSLYQLGGFYLPFVVLPSCIITAGLVSLCIIPSKFKENPSHRPSVFGMLSIPVFTISMSFLLMFYGVLYLQMAFLALQLNLYELTPIQISLVFLTAPLLYMLFTPLAGLLVDKKPHWSHWQIIIAFTFVGVCLTLIGPAPFYHIENPPLWMLITAFALVGAFGSNIVAAISLMFRSVIDAGWPDTMETYGMVAGFFQSSGSMGGAIGAILGGIMYEAFGWGWVMAGTGFLVWAQVLCMLAATIHKVNKDKKNGKDEKIPLAKYMVMEESDEDGR